MAREEERDVRQVYPTASELQRMSFYAKDRLRRRLVAQARPAVEEPEPAADCSRKLPERLSQDYVTTCHRRFEQGDTTDAVRVGEREYQRRAKERQRAEAAGAPKTPRQQTHRTWDLEVGIRLRKQGMRWVDIATVVNASDGAVRKAVVKELGLREMGKEAA